jgi:hypothetical protein
MSSCFFDWQVREAEICGYSQSPQLVNRYCTSNLNPGSKSARIAGLKNVFRNLTMLIGALHGGGYATDGFEI